MGLPMNDIMYILVNRDISPIVNVGDGEFCRLDEWRTNTGYGLLCRYLTLGRIA